MKFLEMNDDLDPCGMFTIGHFLLLFLTITTVLLALKYTKAKKEEKVKKIIQVTTVFLWILEIFKIVLTIRYCGLSAVNKYVPLYFCSLILYAGILSGFSKGKLQHIGDVFLSTGGIVASLVFLICPLTSLPNYPMFHFISFHSFLLHGSMLYIGLLLITTNYIKLTKKDILYYSGLIITLSIIALIFNKITGGNLMFVSENFPGTFIEIIYDVTGPFFSAVMILTQATLPFYIVYTLVDRIER